jgi:hypothetical protein
MVQGEESRISMVGVSLSADRASRIDRPLILDYPMSFAMPCASETSESKAVKQPIARGQAPENHRLIKSGMAKPKTSNTKYACP